MDDRAVGGGWLELLQVLGDRLARHGQAVAVQQAHVEQLLHHDGHPADAVQVAHDEAPRGPDVHQVGNPARDPVEVVERQLYVSLARDRQQVKDGVGRTRQRHRDRYGVLERLLRHDLARPDVHLHQASSGAARLPGGHLSPVVDRRRAGRAGQRHAEGLADGRHRVGRVHAGARTRRRTGGSLYRVKLGVVYGTIRVSAHGLEHVLDRDVLAQVCARQDRSAVQIDGRQVQACHGHQHPGLGLVAARDPDQGIHPLGVHHQLDRVSDQVSGHQARLHALVTHRDAVGDRDGREFDRNGSALTDALLGERGQLVQVVVAGRDLVPGRSHRYLGLAEVLLAEPDGAQHGSGRGALGPLGDFPAAETTVPASHVTPPG